MSENFVPTICGKARIDIPESGCSDCDQLENRVTTLEHRVDGVDGHIADLQDCCDEVHEELDTKLTTVDIVAGRNIEIDTVGNAVVIHSEASVDLSNYYNKVEIDEMLSDIEGLELVLVDTLPATGQSGKIYLLKIEGSTNREEYLWVNNQWELIGDTSVDLSNYYNKTEVNTLLNNKVDKVAGKGLSTNDYTNEEKTKLAGIEAGAEVNVQSDWNVTDPTSDAFIKNKPDLSNFLTCETLPDCRGYFTGVNDITIDAGDAFDPRAGVSAYNNLDEPIPFVAIPSSVDTSTEGVYQVVYIANGTDPVVRTVTVQAATSLVPYAYFDWDTEELHFFLDEEGKYTERQSIGDREYFLNSLQNNQENGWNEYNDPQGEDSPIGKIVFDDPISPLNCERFFDACLNVATIEHIERLDTSKATSTKGMFLNCWALTSLDLSNFDTSNVTNMNSMFTYCFALTSLDVSSFDTSKVTDMTAMFRGCGALTSLDVSNFNTSKVTDMIGMFESCRTLTSLDLSSFDASSLTSIGQLFGECRELRTIYASPSFDLSHMSNEPTIFYGCTRLVGGAGTAYNSSATSNARAKIDGGTSDPGYFTAA